VHFDCPAPDELERDEDWWRIYRDSFAANTLEPPEVILGSIRNGVGLAFRARAGNVTIAIATTHQLRRPEAVFLVYLAVERAHRGKGTGGELMEYAWTRASAAMRDPLGMIWEVDEAVVPFYRRHGGVLLPRSYFQPPLIGTEPVPMELMFRPAAGKSLPDETIQHALVRAMYFEKYGAQNGIPDEILSRLSSSPV
jgi:GNAT superfamily N-acetyltransferase